MDVSIKDGGLYIRVTGQSDAQITFNINNNNVVSLTLSQGGNTITGELIELPN